MRSATEKSSSSSLVLSCEHATHDVPAAFRHLFHGQQDVLESHRGWDPGTAALGKALKCRFRAPLFQTSVSRLLIEVNRSRGHPRLFSEFSRNLSEAEKQYLIETYYLNYRNRVEEEIRRLIAVRSPVLHLSLHSFTPQLGDEIRNADIGLLYDPRRELEKQFCERWSAELKRNPYGWRVRRNYPYLGIADGFTTYLRKQFPATDYSGIELEINQRHMSASNPEFKRMVKLVCDTLARVLGRSG